LLWGARGAGGWVAGQPHLAPLFTHSATGLTWMMAAYGFIASVLPVWMLLCPRDYLSTFLKITTILVLAVAILVILPPLRMPALTPFATLGEGPVFAGKLFPFAFITIACGAISGFHSLVASGTTPKMIAREADARLIGYGGMLMESFVGVMAMIAACTLDPGVYFAMNTTPAALAQASQVLGQAGFVVTPDFMRELAARMGETTLLARSGGAPALAVGIAPVFAGARGGLGILPVSGGGGPAGRDHLAVAAVRDLEPAAGGGGVVRRDHDSHQDGPRAVRLGDRRAARLARDRHDDRRMAEGVLGRSAARVLGARRVARRVGQPRYGAVDLQRPPQHVRRAAVHDHRHGLDRDVAPGMVACLVASQDGGGT